MLDQGNGTGILVDTEKTELFPPKPQFMSKPLNSTKRTIAGIHQSIVEERYASTAVHWYTLSVQAKSLLLTELVSQLRSQTGTAMPQCCRVPPARQHLQPDAAAAVHLGSAIHQKIATHKYSPIGP